MGTGNRIACIVALLVGCGDDAAAKQASLTGNNQDQGEAQDAVPGMDGADGRDSLMRVEAEPAGKHCEAGGSAIHAGLDADADGTLSDAEISSTGYSCNAVRPVCEVVFGDVSIKNSRDIDAIRGCTEITGDLIVHNTHGLLSLQGLESLHTVGGRISISSNVSLTSLDGLQGLRTVKDTYAVEPFPGGFKMGLIISANSVLTDVTALSGVQLPEDREISISNNALLPQANAEAFGEAIGTPCLAFEQRVPGGSPEATRTANTCEKNGL